MTGFDLKAHWPLLVLALAVTQWLVFLAVSVRSRGRGGTDWRLMISSAALAVVWVVVFDARTLFAAKKDVPAASAGAQRSVPRATCSSIEVGASADTVKSKLGNPDEERLEEDTRGPGAKAWIYRGPRCNVHLLDDQVDFID